MKFAETYSRLGWQICRIRPGQKSPTEKDWGNKTFSDAALIQQELDAGNNIGLKLGPASGVIDVEFDSESGEALLNELIADEPDTTCAYKSSKSIHRIYRLQNGLPDKTKIQSNGLECRLNMQNKALQSALPPSVHSSGAVYTWLPGRSPEDIEPQLMPLRLLAWIRKTAEEASTAKLEVDDDGDLIAPIGERHDAMRRYITDLWSKGYSQRQVRDMAHAFDHNVVRLDDHNADEQIDDLIEWAVENVKQKRKKDPQKPYTLNVEWGNMLLEKEIKHEWLIKGVVVKNEPMVIGGPTKCLKTSMVLDMACSIATGVPFLGQFDVPKKKKIVVISGESGERTIQQFLRTWLKAKDLPDESLANLGLFFRLPKLDDPIQVDCLINDLRKIDCDTVVIDPLYRSLRAGNDASNVYAMGEKLDGIAHELHSAGISVILVHHFRKTGKNFDDAPELEDLSQAGIAEFARQFLFVKRREAYKHDGDHKIWMTWGGSAGHQGLRICQAKTGTFEKGAEWSTDLYTVGQWKERQDGERVERERTESRNVKAELKRYIGDNGGTNKTAAVEYVATLQNVPKTRTKLYLDELIGEGDVEVTQTSKTRTALSLVECEQLDPCGC